MRCALEGIGILGVRLGLKAIRADLSKDLKEIEVLALADWHWADPQSDHDRIRADIEYIAAHDNVHCILNGDLLNCAIRSAMSDCYAEITPMEELRACVELFEPIAEKILCVVPGNHEARHYRTNGIDITELMCRQLGIEDRYSPTAALLFVRLGRLGSDQHCRKVAYTIHVSHGSGGGRKEGGKIQRLADMATIVDADIYVVGHSHLPALFKDRFARPNMANSSITYGTRLYVNTSSKLEYSGGYGETMGLKVPCLDTPVIHLSGTRKEMRATI